jgi:hypothetical protein
MASKVGQKANFAVSWRSLGGLLEPLEGPDSAPTVQSAGGVWIELSGLRVHCYFVAMWCHLGSVLFACDMFFCTFVCLRAANGLRSAPHSYQSGSNGQLCGFLAIPG